MATQNHTDNFGLQSGAAYSLVMTATSAGQTLPIPVGYSVDAGDTNVTDNGDGTMTFTAAGSTTLIPQAATAHEVADSAGSTIEANTVNQSSL